MCGAARVVKFSPGSSTELLAFTEQSRHFHLVDARSLDPSTQHTIELPPLKGNATPARPPVSSPESDWRTLLHPFGSVDSDVPRHARLRVEREPEPPTVSLLSTNRRQVPPGQWPCLIPRSPSNAPLLDPRGDNAETVASWSSPESSLHSFFYGDGLTSPRRPPWRDLAVHDTETRAPQLQSDGYLTLGDNPSQQRPREDRSPGIATEDMTTRAELDAGFGLLHIPTWADVSAHDPFSISGMDWDPSGQKLYLATSTGAYEYSVYVTDAQVRRFR